MATCEVCALAKGRHKSWPLASGFRVVTCSWCAGPGPTGRTAQASGAALSQRRTFDLQLSNAPVSPAWLAEQKQGRIDLDRIAHRKAELLAVLAAATKDYYAHLTPEQCVTAPAPTTAELCARAGIALCELENPQGPPDPTNPDIPYTPAWRARVRAAMPAPPSAPCIAARQAAQPASGCNAPGAPPTLGADASMSTPVTLGDVVIEELHNAEDDATRVEEDLAGADH